MERPPTTPEPEQEKALSKREQLILEAQTRARTNKLEAGLEQNAPHKRILKSAAIIGAGLITGRMLAPFVFDQKAEKISKEQKPATQEEIIGIERATGVSLKDLENNGFRVTLDVKSNSGRYMIHIGQTHSGGEKVSKETKEEVVGSQKAIEKNLKILLKGNRCESRIWLEGNTEGKVVENYIAQFRSEIKALKDSPSFKERSRELLKKELEKMGSDPEITVIPKYIYEQEVGDKVLDDGTTAPKSSSEQDSQGNDIYYHLGAPFKMMLDGTVEVESAEDPEAINAATAASNSFYEMQNELNSNPALKENKEFIESFLKKKAEKDRIVLEAREDIAIKKTMGNLGSGAMKHRILVFGDAHEFKNNVIDSNEKIPAEQRFGLISLHQNITN